MKSENHEKRKSFYSKVNVNSEKAMLEPSACEQSHPQMDQVLVQTTAFLFFWCMHHMITWLEMAQLHRVNSPNMSCWIALKKFIGSFVHSFLSHPTGPTKSVTWRSSASFSPKDAQKSGLLDPSTWKQIQKEIGNHRAIFGWSWLLPTQLNFGGSSKLPRLGGHEKCSMRHTLSILEPRLPRCRPFFHVVLLHYANFSACFFRQF